MMHDEAKYIRKTIQFDPDVLSEIEGMAKSKNWSFPFMCSELLKFALKEKKRKRKGSDKEDNT